MNVKDKVSQISITEIAFEITEIAFEMLSTYLDRYILKKLYVSLKVIKPVFQPWICDLLTLEQVNLLIQDSASSPTKLCAWIRSPLQTY